MSNIKKKIDKQQIFKAAVKIVAAGHLPTAMKVKAMLATGSMATIQKYLQEWKKNCFQLVNLGNNNVISAGSQKSYAELIEKQQFLERNLNKQISQNEHYANELIDTEKALIKFKEENQQLQISNKQLQLELKEAIAVKDTLEKLHQELQAKLDHNNNQTISQQQHIINDLRVELKILNETSLSALRDTSIQGHEALMQEKVDRINLQAKIDTLTKELAETKKQLELTELKTKIQVQTLERQIKTQQQVLRQYIAPEEFSQLEEGLGASLLAGGYGK